MGGEWEETLNRAEGRQGVDDVSFSEEEMSGPESDEGWVNKRGKANELQESGIGISQC